MLATCISFLLYSFFSKLRAKLGLKPLELNESKKGEWCFPDFTLTNLCFENAFCSHHFCNYSELGTKEEPLPVDAINPIQIRQQNEIREKMAALKEKRLLNQKLG